MKRLLIVLALAAAVAPLAGCVVYPARPVGCVWVPGHVGAYGYWHPGHCA